MKGKVGDTVSHIISIFVIWFIVNTIKAIKSKYNSWTSNKFRRREIKTSYKILVGNLKGKGHVADIYVNARIKKTV